MRRRRGLSLLELGLAAGLGVVVLGTAFAALGASGRVEARTRDASRDLARAVAAAGWLRRDLDRLLEGALPGTVHLGPPTGVPVDAPEPPERGSLGLVLAPAAPGEAPARVLWTHDRRRQELLRVEGDQPRAFPLGPGARVEFEALRTPGGAIQGLAFRIRLETSTLEGQVAYPSHLSRGGFAWWNPPG